MKGCGPFGPGLGRSCWMTSQMVLPSLMAGHLALPPSRSTSSRLISLPSTGVSHLAHLVRQGNLFQCRSLRRGPCRIRRNTKRVAMKLHRVHAPIRENHAAVFCFLVIQHERPSPGPKGPQPLGASGKSVSVSIITTWAMPYSKEYQKGGNERLARKARSLSLPPFWYSFEYGMAHVVMIDTETDFPDGRSCWMTRKQKTAAWFSRIGA
jgi:hypothetical protein